MVSYTEKVADRITPERCLVRMPYGSGKTLVSLTKAYKIWQDNQSRIMAGHNLLMAIVICEPKNVHTWAKQIREHFNNEVEYVDASQFDELYEIHFSKVDVDLVPRVLVLPLRRAIARYREVAVFRTAALILDESTLIANASSERGKYLVQLSENANALQRIALTGNAWPERPEQIHNQFRFCYPGNMPFPKNRYKFLEEWFVKADYEWILKHDLQDQFWGQVADCMVQLTETEHEEFIKSKGVDHMVYMIEEYDETDEQRRLLNVLEDTWSLPKALVEDTTVDLDQVDEYWHTMAVLKKRQQIASGFYYVNAKVPVFLKDQPKARALVELLEKLIDESPTRRIVIWYEFDAELEILKGAIPQIDREVYFWPGMSDKALESFSNTEEMTDKSMIIALQSSYARGLNDLVTADVSVCFSPGYSQEKHDQMVARLDRLGQRHPMIYWIDLCSPNQIDIEIVTALQSKSLTEARLSTIVNQYRSQEKQ